MSAKINVETSEKLAAFAAKRQAERDEEKRLCEERHRAGRAQRDAEYEQVQQLARRYAREVPDVSRMRKGDLDDGYTRRMRDHGEGLQVSGPSLGLLGEPENVEELVFE